MKKSKPITVTTFSEPELLRRGWKKRLNEDSFYKGDSKWPQEKTQLGQYHLLGRSFEVIGLTGEKTRVKDSDGEEYLLPKNLVKIKARGGRAQKTIVKDEVAKFNGFGFEFPCSARNLSRDDAKKLATWILRVVK